MLGFDIFLSEFLDYVLSLSIERDSPVNFGNMDFDYCVLFDGVDYWLEIYPVALDHYGMPYRNVLEVDRHIVSSYFRVQGGYIIFLNPGKIGIFFYQVYIKRIWQDNYSVYSREYQSSKNKR